MGFALASLPEFPTNFLSIFRRVSRHVVVIVTVLLAGCAGEENVGSQPGNPPPPSPTHLLSVAKSGTGTVTSNPSGVNCGSDCSESYPAGTIVTLIASAGAGSTFANWSGACSGSNQTCSVTMTSDRNVTAVFTAAGTGTAILTWDPNSEPDLAGYRVYYGTASGIYGTPIDVGNVTTYTLSNLSAGVTYYFAVTAYDFSRNESGFSSEVNKTIP